MRYVVQCNDYWCSEEYISSAGTARRARREAAAAGWGVDWPSLSDGRSRHDFCPVHKAEREKRIRSA